MYIKIQEVFLTHNTYEIDDMLINRGRRFPTADFTLLIYHMKLSSTEPGEFPASGRNSHMPGDCTRDRRKT